MMVLGHLCFEKPAEKKQRMEGRREDGKEGRREGRQAGRQASKKRWAGSGESTVHRYMLYIFYPSIIII